MTSHEWLFRRNCSMTPRQLGLFYLSLACVSLGISGYFAAHGAWLVMLFAVLEMSMVGTAFLVYARHATDRERIVLDGSCLTVELIECEKSTEFKLDARCTTVKVPAKRQDLIRLDAPSTRIEIGRYLTDFRRREFARELLFAMREAIRSGSRAEF
jgi:uncharacterized membrane protein